MNLNELHWKAERRLAESPAVRQACKNMHSDPLLAQKHNWKRKKKKKKKTVKKNAYFNYRI